MKIRYTPTAFAQLEEIIAYITVHSPQGAARVYARVHRVIGLLCDFPFSGMQTDDPRIRRVVTTPYPYLVYYEVTAGEVVIHAIRHGARDPNSRPGQASS